MEEQCKECWNTGCKQNAELIKSKIDVCKHMKEHPEEWDEDFIGHYEEDDY